MVCYQTKNSNLGKFSMALDWKKWICFVAIGNNLRTFEIFYDHLVHYVFIWYILCSFGTFFAVLVPRTNKNLATLARKRKAETKKPGEMLIENWISHIFKHLRLAAAITRFRAFL
jgi:hypothetical protein